MNDVFNRVLQLALRTGDKVIVVDPNQAKPYVMMDIDDYEKLLARPEKASAESILRTELENQQKEYSATSVPIKIAQTSEPRFASAISGSDPLEPDSASPASTQSKSDKITEPLETEEYFYLEPIER